MSPKTEHAKAPGVIRVIVPIGVSEKRWSDAAQQAVARASQTLWHITGLDVVKSRGVVRDGKIVEYRVEVKIAFIAEPAEIEAEGRVHLAVARLPRCRSGNALMGARG